MLYNNDGGIFGLQYRKGGKPNHTNTTKKHNCLGKQLTRGIILT